MNLMMALKEIADERGIDEYELLDRLEQSLAGAYERTLRLENDCRVTIDRDTGAIYVYELIPDPDFDWVNAAEDEEPTYEERDVTPDGISRLAAHQAKSVINSMVREAKRERIFDEYIDRVGDMVSGPVQHSRSNFSIIKLSDDVEAELPERERPNNERYHHNDRIKVYITEVRQTRKANEASIIVSRKHPGLVKRLFEIEVPEIADGIVEIRSIAREAGVRSKVAVSSRQDNLDPVGACVGPAGSRVRNVVHELRGERIDIIPFSESPTEFVASALSPAKVQRVIIDEDTRTANVIVAPDQLSLAIGKEGQNARLAAQLTGWRIDIKSLEMASAAGLTPDVTAMEDLGEIDTQCIAENADGHRCRNHARPGSQYCGVHEKSAKKAAKKSTGKDDKNKAAKAKTNEKA
ncbi:MAG: transcription termination factor NusA [Coriobacteriia bacterium]|nr:transcription termination factor NusA [Coriobacteriia bacterium]